MDPKDFLLFAQKGSGAMQDSDGVLDFEAYMNTANSIFWPVHILSDFPGEIYGGVFFRHRGAALSTADLITFKSDATQLGRLRINTANAKLELIVNGVVEEIGTVNIQLDTLYHVQFRYLLSAGAGVFEVKLDEELDILTFNGDTTAGGFSWVNRIEFSASNSGTYFDSLYINDTNDIGDGSNGYDGVRRMTSYVPIADGFWQQWLLTSGGDGFAMVNQTPHDSDTTIAYSTVNGDKVSFQVAPHGFSSPVVLKAVSARWVVRKVSNGRIRPFFRINGTDYPIALASVPVGVGYTCVMDRRVINPDTGLAWDLADTIDSVGLEAIL